MSDEIWSGDLLSRQSDARLIIDFLRGRCREWHEQQIGHAYVLNLDAAWGKGKSFFLTRLQKQLESEGHLVCYINAWKDDAASEPLIAVMAAVESALKPHLKTRRRLKALWDKALVAAAPAAAAIAKGAVTKIASKVIGEGAREVVEIFDHARPTPAKSKPDDTVDGGIGGEIEKATSEQIGELATRYITEKISTYHRRVHSTEQFKSNLSKLILQGSNDGDFQPTFFILVDELDRCRPTYAIETLEQIKHLFDVPGLAFVIATDSEQLAHCVKAIYGSEFDSPRYLNRFFNRRYQFPPVTLNRFVEYLFAAYPVDKSKLSVPPRTTEVDFFIKFVELIDISLRDVEQIFQMFRDFITTWNTPTAINEPYLLTAIWAFHANNFSLTNALSGGPDVSIPELSTWKFFYQTGSPSGPRTNSTSANDLIQALRQNAKQDLYKIVSQDTPAGDIPRWIREGFESEFNQLAQGKFTPGKPMPSILLTYSARVHALGQLHD